MVEILAGSIEYRVTFQDCGPGRSTPWPAGSWPTKAGAWKRVRMQARHIAAGWPEPVIARVYAVKAGAAIVLVYKADINPYTSNTSIGY